MSYDILLYPRQPGEAWSEAIAAAEADDEALASDEEALSAGVETFRRVEARLTDVLEGPLESWVAQETGGDVYGELTASDSGIEFSLFDRGAEVSFTDPEPGSRDREQLHRQVRRAVGVVAEETGYVAYDPQTGESFDGIVRDESELEPDQHASSEPATAGGTPVPHRNPASLRRRGWVYLILGVVLVLLAGQRLTADNGGTLTVVLLVIGVLDVLGGAFLLSVARRAQSDQTLDTGGGPAV